MAAAKSFFVVFLLWMPIMLYGQRKIAGTVYDAETKTALPFATIKLDEHGRGTVADLNGHFEANADGLPDGALIEVSYTGYAAQKVALSAKKEMSISLS